MYIDESGDTATLSQNGKKFLVLTGCIVEADDKISIEKRLRTIKHRYYQDADVEIKSNFLRYANPDLPDYNSPLKLHARSKYDELEADIAEFLKTIPVTLIAVAIDKSHFWTKYPSKSPYESAYVFLLERFQFFLKNKNDSLGICILDPREGQVEKHYIGEEIDQAHHELRFAGSKAGVCCDNIIERVLFSTSDLNIGIQIADLYCYPIFHIFEYNKKSDEYWRYSDVTSIKFHNKNGKVDGIGLKVFPEESKKDLRFFE